MVWWVSPVGFDINIKLKSISRCFQTIRCCKIILVLYAVFIILYIRILGSHLWPYCLTCTVNFSPRMSNTVNQSSIDIFVHSSNSSLSIGKVHARAIPLYLGSLLVDFVNGTGTRCQGTLVSLLISRVLLIVIGRLIPEHCRATPKVDQVYTCI